MHRPIAPAPSGVERLAARVAGARLAGAAVLAALIVLPAARAQDAAEWRAFTDGYDLVQIGIRELRAGNEERGRAAIAKGRAKLHESIERFPHYGPNHYGLALADFAQANDVAAEQHLRECLRKQPDYGPARIRLVHHLLDAGRVSDAREVLEWFSPDVPPFDEQADHFESAAKLWEDLGEHGRAYRLALEAWERDISKFAPRARSDGDDEPEIDYEKTSVEAMLWPLAVNALLCGHERAAHWRAELARALGGEPLPFELVFLDEARRFREGEREGVLERLAVGLLDAKTREKILPYLGPPPEDDRRRRGRMSRPWVVYFGRMLGEEAPRWGAFVRTELPEYLREEADLRRDGAPGEAAALAALSGELSGEEPPELLLFIAECHREDGAYREAIEVLDRALAMEPRYGYKYRKLKERCERELRRFRPRR